VEQPPGLRARISTHELDLILRRLDSLPTLPVVAARALELSAPPGAEAAGPAAAPGELAALIARDPPLTAKLLSLANASAPGRSATAASAVGQVGADAVRSAVLSTKALAPPPAGDDEALYGAGFWRHCLAVASAARMLAERVNPGLDGEEVFAAGLLHDIGKLVLASLAPKSYARALAAARGGNGNLADHEKEILGVDHLVAGRRLAQRWNLPRAIENVIWLHHQPSEAVPPSVGEADLVRIVALADAIARRRRIGLSPGRSSRATYEGLCSRLGIPAAAVREVAEALPEAVEGHVRILGLDRWDGEAISRDALAAANEELGRLNEQLRRGREALSAEAEAFRHFSAFAAALGPQAQVADVLRQMADVFMAAPTPGRDRPPGPVVAYSFDDEEAAVLAVRCEAAAPPTWRTFPLAGAAADRRAGEPASPAGESIRHLLLDGEQWRDWARAGACTHQVLSCAGQWLGGVLYPAGRTDEVPHALAAALGTALGIVQQRCRSAALGEELARASQRLAEMQDALADARTLAAVEDIATGAAHELNNPLAVVSGRAQMMGKKTRSQRQREAWQTIADQAQRISDILAELMEFARPPQPEATEIDAAKLLTAAAEAFAASDHPQAGTSHVDIEIDEDVPAIRADREQIQMVIEELIANAAAAPAVHVRLRAAADEPNDAVLLTVTDDGAGMDAATVARARTPFFSARAAGRRHGLGLPRAGRYVENNRGRMWIDSTPGEGTTVSVRLPGAWEVPGEREQS